MALMQMPVVFAVARDSLMPGAVLFVQLHVTSQVLTQSSVIGAACQLDW